MTNPVDRIRMVCYDPRWSGDPTSSVSIIPSYSELSKDLDQVKADGFEAIATYKVLKKTDLPPDSQGPSYNDGPLIQLAVAKGLNISIGLYANAGAVSDWHSQVDIIVARINDATITPIKSSMFVSETSGARFKVPVYL